MKQVICKIAHHHLSGYTTHYETFSYPMYDYEVEAYIANNKPTNPHYEIVSTKVVDIDKEV